MGVSCQIRGKKQKKKRQTNPSHSLFKAANVSFEEIILFGHLIALGNYEPLQGMSGITRTGYQRGTRTLWSSSPSSLSESYHRNSPLYLECQVRHRNSKKVVKSDSWLYESTYDSMVVKILTHQRKLETK